MSTCGPNCFNPRCSEIACTGARLLKLEEALKHLNDRSQNVSLRLAELRKALDDAREDFTNAMNAFRRQLAPLNVPLVRKRNDA